MAKIIYIVGVLIITAMAAQIAYDYPWVAKESLESITGQPLDITTGTRQ